MSNKHSFSAMAFAAALLVLCASVGDVAAAGGTITLRSGGSVRLPDDPEGFIPTQKMGGSALKTSPEGDPLGRKEFERTPGGLSSAPQGPHGDVLRFAQVFGDGMVLQREKPLPIWGFAEPGEKITVSFAGQEVGATADASGRWSVRLAPLAASCEGLMLSVSAQPNGQTSGQSSNQIILSNVLVGDVWILAGQSNMQYGLRGTDGWADARAKSARGELSALRFFVPTRSRVPRRRVPI